MWSHLPEVFPFVTVAFLGKTSFTRTGSVIYSRIRSPFWFCRFVNVICILQSIYTNWKPTTKLSTKYITKLTIWNLGKKEVVKPQVKLECVAEWVIPELIILVPDVLIFCAVLPNSIVGSFRTVTAADLEKIFRWGISSILLRFSLVLISDRSVGIWILWVLASAITVVIDCRFPDP